MIDCDWLMVQTEWLIDWLFQLNNWLIDGADWLIDWLFRLTDWSAQLNNWLMNLNRFGRRVPCVSKNGGETGESQHGGKVGICQGK